MHCARAIQRHALTMKLSVLDRRLRKDDEAILARSTIWG
jgi:hypothetical protein